MPKTIGLFLLSLCLMLPVSCTKPTMMPSELIGRWVTQAPEYADRYIEINKTELIFGTGAETPTVFFIKKIKKNNIDEFIEWTFHCTTLENVPMDIVLFYTKGEDGSHFELRNKRYIQWRKVIG